ncbi:MAG: hypothetical protein NT072_11845 [Deltaproteobacteria bacterium]|nr:hypothetical protein [Deltaproteobacteria bacterium]
MIVLTRKERCKRCGGEAVVLCDGCGIALCKECRVFDMWGYGCGHIDTKAFCSSCMRDININPYCGIIGE